LMAAAILELCPDIECERILHRYRTATVGDTLQHSGDGGPVTIIPPSPGPKPRRQAR
jgi:hypothetical protein